jgi:hypothetical protein
MGRRFTIRQRILAGFETARRSMTREDLAGWFFSHAREWREVQGELDAMVADGELVITGVRLDPDIRRNPTPRRTYGLPGVIYGVPGPTSQPN